MFNIFEEKSKVKKSNLTAIVSTFMILIMFFNVQFIYSADNNQTKNAQEDYLRISELMYYPEANHEDLEFIELYNINTSPLDITNVAFTVGVTYTFSTTASLPAKGMLLLVAFDPASVDPIEQARKQNFLSYYNLTEGSITLKGPYVGKLSNSGEQLTVIASNLDNIMDFEYSDTRSWPLAPQGSGHSLVPIDSAVINADTKVLNYGGNWRASTYIKGSPGQVDPIVQTSVIINEFDSHTDYFDPEMPEYDSNDWIELYNTRTTNISLTNYYLSDDIDELDKWAIPTSLILAKSYLSFDETTDFHYPINTGFGLNKTGESIILSYLPGTSQNRIVDCVKFKGQEINHSYGRYPDADPYWQTLFSPSQDIANIHPNPELIINEFMYNPPLTPQNPTENTADEFIEIYNPTTHNVALWNDMGTWVIDGGVQFIFPSDVLLASGESMLIVSIDPAVPTALTAFKVRYGITNPNLKIYGPYTGTLSNSTEKIGIEKPQEPDVITDPVSWIVVDEATYFDRTPWDSEADGTGNSFHRLSNDKAGDDPTNWSVASPSPGTVPSVSPKSDVSGWKSY